MIKGAGARRAGHQALRREPRRLHRLICSCILASILLDAFSRNLSLLPRCLSPLTSLVAGLHESLRQYARAEELWREGFEGLGGLAAVTERGGGGAPGEGVQASGGSTEEDKVTPDDATGATGRDDAGKEGEEGEAEMRGRALLQAGTDLARVLFKRRKLGEAQELCEALLLRCVPEPSPTANSTSSSSSRSGTGEGGTAPAPALALALTLRDLLGNILLSRGAADPAVECFEAAVLVRPI